MTTTTTPTDGAAATDGGTSGTDRGRSPVEEVRDAVLHLLSTYRLDLSDDLRALDRVIKVAQLPNPADFDAAWAQMEALGYRYGEDALEQVRFGFELARGATPPAAPNYGPATDPERDLIELLDNDCGVDIGDRPDLLDQIIALGARIAAQRASTPAPYSLNAAIVELLLRNPDTTLARLMGLLVHLDDRLRRVRPMLLGQPFERIPKDELLELLAKIEAP